MHKQKWYLCAPEGDGGSGGSGTPSIPPADGGATPPSGGTPPTPPAGGTPPAPPTGEWYDSFQDPNVKEWVKAYGPAYKTPEAMALKAYNLEKFVGAEKAGRGIIVPKSDASPEEWKAFYAKVGSVPAEATGYVIPKDFESDPLMGKFREFAHKEGIPPKFFDAMMSFYSKDIAGAAVAQQQARDSELSAASEKDIRDLQVEWQGKDNNGAPIYDKNVELGRRAAKEFVPHTNEKELSDFLLGMEVVMGTKNMLKFWANVGGSIGEHGSHGGGEGGDGGDPNRPSTPEGARLRIAELKRDQEWAKKFTSGDVDARRVWDQLHKIAHPEQK